MKFLLIVTALFSADPDTIKTNLAFYGGPKHYSVFETKNTCIVSGDQVEIRFEELEPIVFTISRKRKIRHLKATWYKIEGEGETEYFIYKASGFAFYDPVTKSMHTYLNR